MILNVDQVRNETAENFLTLLKDWKNLCQKFSFISSSGSKESITDVTDEEKEGDENEDAMKKTHATDFNFKTP